MIKRTTRNKDGEVVETTILNDDYETLFTYLDDIEVSCKKSNKGKIIKVRYPYTSEDSYEYDDKGNLIKTKYSSGYEKSYEYDDKGKIIKAKNSDGEEYTYEYGEIREEEDMNSKVCFTNTVVNFKDSEFNLDISSFLVQDAYSIIHDIFDEIILCEQLFIPKEERRKGLGSKLLKEFIDSKIKDDKLYFVYAGFSVLEYTEEEFEAATNEERKELFEKLDKFYTKNGFVDVNKHIGFYENKVVYVYNNEAGKVLLKRIEESTERTIKPNTVYKHFKGNYYYVLGTAIDATNTDEERIVVVYRSLYNADQLFVREVKEFLSEVDHEKYPDVKQKYRFEEFKID